MKKISFIILMLLIVGCSAKAFIKPEYDRSKIKKVALLPITIKSEIASERAELLKTQLLSALRNFGFTVVDPKVVAKICSDSNCSKKELLFENYAVDAVINMEINSFSKNSFLAGYYNTISGKIELKDKNDSLLVEAENSESDRGGIIFNSGQLIQGIITQVKNSEESGIDALTARFLKNLVAKIPAPTFQIIGGQEAPIIKQVYYKTLNANVANICAEGSPSLMASIIIDGTRSSLREIYPGLYCSNYALLFLKERESLDVELKTPYGVSIKSALALNSGVK